MDRDVYLLVGKGCLKKRMPFCNRKDRFLRGYINKKIFDYYELILKDADLR